MITCILVDDNRPVCENLEFSLGVQYPDKIKVLATAFSIAEAKVAIQNHLPDVVFLDAHLPLEGGSALISWLYRNKIFKHIETIKVFLYTARTEVYESIKDGEWRYPVRILNKGIHTIPDFGELIEEAERWISADKAMKHLKIGYESVYIGDIQHFESDLSNVKIHTANGLYRAGYPLARFKKMIADQPTNDFPLPHYFFFATNDYIFNRLFIKNYEPDIITLHNNTQITLSRSVQAAFDAWWRS